MDPTGASSRSSSAGSSAEWEEGMRGYVALEVVMSAAQKSNPLCTPVKLEMLAAQCKNTSYVSVFQKMRAGHTRVTSTLKSAEEALATRVGRPIVNTVKSKKAALRKRSNNRVVINGKYKYKSCAARTLLALNRIVHWKYTTKKSVRTHATELLPYLMELSALQTQCTRPIGAPTSGQAALVV